MDLIPGICTRPPVPSRWVGLAAATGLAALAWPLALAAARAGMAISPLLLALLLGLLVAWGCQLPPSLAPGLSFASRTLLRAAVVLLGLRIGLREITAIGADGLAAIVLLVAATLGFGLWISRRLGLGADAALLLAASHAICGAAAVAALDSVLRARQADVAQALTLVTLAGTVAMLACPLLGSALSLSAEQYGFWVGGSVHEVAQAVAAGHAMGETQGHAASLWKMARVACLLPTGVVVAVLAARRQRAAAASLRSLVPWFVLGFLAVAAADAAGLIPAAVADALRQLGDLLMAIAMAALGLNSSWRELLRTGFPALAAAGTTTLFVSALALSLATLRH